ncbi:MAG: SDR family NAD(P)-dependent oxidoreductase [Lachnospiraceae bacterium]|nr:SDR family NAD(P)-dependent oxidoreductase [Lachnospiraceae bacterium]
MKNLAIITGASGGLGKAFTKYLIDEVDEVWAIGRNREKLNSLKETFGVKIRDYSVDLSNTANLEIIKRELNKEEYSIKYLVNNAGSGRMARSTDFSAQDIESHINTHNTSMAVLCNICIPYMKKGSHIINVASQSAFQPVAYINLYAASKAFCCSYSRALNMELKERGIVVTVACPGWIKTDLLQTEMNGHKIKFPHLAEPDDVAVKTIRDAKKGRDISVYSAYVKMMQFFSKFYPHKWIMRVWLRSVKKYIE